MKSIINKIIESVRATYPIFVFFVSAGFVSIGVGKDLWIGIAAGILGFIWAEDMIKTRAALKARHDLISDLLYSIMKKVTRP